MRKHTKEFKLEIGTQFKDNKRNLIILDRKYKIKIFKNGTKSNERWYKYKCNKCGWTEGWIREDHLLNGIGCSCCRGFTVVEGINDIPTTAPWMVKYFQGGYNKAKLYTKGTHQKIFPICPDCGRIKDKAISIREIYKYHSIGCVCGDGYSYPEKLMFNMLEQLHIEFQTEYSPNWCHFIFQNKIRKGIYDFYFKINNKKYIIEMDGGFHYKDNKLSKQTLKESIQIDNKKDNLANEHDIEIIRIDCNYEHFHITTLEYIKNNILHSKLNNIFDLSKIDWNITEEFALSNLIKETCILWNNGINSTKKLSEKMNLNRHTITTYLKKGTTLNWCNYNSKKEMIKSLEKGRKWNIRKIICTTTNKIFESIAIGAKEYDSYTSGIIQCCQGKKKSAGKHPITGEKLTWMYYDDYIKIKDNQT